MGHRLDLHEVFLTLAEHVYFQPTNNTQIEYPCIIYSQDSADTKFADDAPYAHTKRYLVTIIDRDPDTPISDRVAALPMCTFSRFYPANDLNHYVYNLFF